MKEEFIGYIEGYLATTNIDSQGDQLTPEAIEQFAEQLRINPDKRTLFYNHDMTQPMGYLIDFHVETKGSWKGIFAEAGIYKSRPDLWDKMKSGEIKGFSYSATILDMEYNKMQNNECYFSIELKSDDWHDIRDMLSQMGAHVEPIVKKAADFPTILNVVTSILALPGIIYGLYTMWGKLSGRDKTKRTWMRIVTTQRKFSFEGSTVEEIVKEIEINSKDSKS